MIIHGKETGNKPKPESFRSTSKCMHQWMQIWEQLILDGGVLCRQLRTSDGSNTKLPTVVPDRLQKEVLLDLHEGALGDHLGTDKTVGHLKERFYILARALQR